MVSRRRMFFISLSPSAVFSTRLERSSYTTRSIIFFSPTLGSLPSSRSNKEPVLLKKEIKPMFKSTLTIRLSDFSKQLSVFFLDTKRTGLEVRGTQIPVLFPFKTFPSAYCTLTISEVTNSTFNMPCAN